MSGKRKASQSRALQSLADLSTLQKQLSVQSASVAPVIPAKKPVVPRPTLLDRADNQTVWQKFLRNEPTLQQARQANRVALKKPPPQPLPRFHENTEEKSANQATVPTLLDQYYDGVQKLRSDNRANLTGQSTTASYQKLSAALDQELGAAPPLGDDFRAGVQALKPANSAPLTKPQAKPLSLPRSRLQDAQKVLQKTIPSPTGADDFINTGDEASFLRNGIPRRVLIDLRRGRWLRQAELDLHGLTREEAHLALVAFINDCLLKGLRCVRLIHGKGNHSPGIEGVLRHLSRNWLAQREEILAFCQATPHEGGTGALFILLRASHKAEVRK